MKTNLVIDTDIGSDADDAFALAYTIKNPKANIKAVHTVHGNTDIRAKIAKKICRLLNVDIPVHIGNAGPLESVEKYWTGIEELALNKPELDEPLELNGPIDYIDTNLICIGPLTNIAEELKNNPTIKKVKNIYVMGSKDEDHNFEADITSKEAVFQEKWNIYQITKEDSLKISFTKDELKNLAINELGKFLYDSACKWLEYSKKSILPMYDVLAVSAAIGENYVKFKKVSNNRFISNGVDLKLKQEIIKSIIS